MSGIIKGKDIVDNSITFDKIVTPYQDGDLSANSATGITLTFDGITGHIYHTDDTFLYVEFTANEEITPVDLTLVGFGTNTSIQRLHGRTLNSIPVAFNALTVGVQSIVQVYIYYNGTTYVITGGSNSAASSLDGSSDLQRCWGYVEKFN